MKNTQKMKFSVENIELVYDNPDDSQFAMLKVQCFATGKSLHDTFVTEETLRKTSKTILLKPLVFVIDKRLDDLGGHDKTEVPGGFVPHDSPIEFDKLADGRTMMTVRVLVWKKYSGKLLDYFARDGSKGVSVEIEVSDARKDEKSGLLELLNYTYCAIAALGDFISAAIPNARAVLEFSEEYEKAYREEFSSRYGKLDFSIPSEVKENCNKGIEMYKETGTGATSVSLAYARYMIKNTHSTPERVRQAHKYFSGKHENETEISYNLWGGFHGKEWCHSMNNQMDEIDSQIVSYFDLYGSYETDGGSTMPYKSLKDINPALKGIDPPISLGQANAIAKQAEAVGSDEKKNGWAIAISSFKKTHKVENGHWVKKENMSEEKFSKDNLGKGSVLKVNKSKEAMSEKSWGEVDKTALRNKVLNASNYKSLVKDVYMLVEEGWEDAPSEHLKYPVMELKGDTLVYNRYGLSAALQRAEGQNESGVVSKVKGIYEKLGLNKKEDMSYEDDNSGTEVEESMKDKNKEEEIMPEEEMAEEETPEEEKQETPEEEKKEEDMAENNVVMSLNEYLDVSALLEFLKNETKQYRELTDKSDEEINYAINQCLGEIAKGKDANMKAITDGMVSFMVKVSSKLEKALRDNKEFSIKNETLSKFKSDIEKKQMQYEIDSVLKEAEQAGMPDEELEKCRQEADNFSLVDIESYKNMVKAKAFKYFGKKDTKGKTVKIGLPFSEPKYTEPSLWK